MNAFSASCTNLVTHAFDTHCTCSENHALSHLFTFPCAAHLFTIADVTFQDRKSSLDSNNSLYGAFRRVSDEISARRGSCSIEPRTSAPASVCPTPTDRQYFSSFSSPSGLGSSRLRLVYIGNMIVPSYFQITLNSVQLTVFSFIEF